MTVFQIQCFLSVAETLNFTEAANRLFIAQSSLSRNISHLEEEIGLTLFIRTKKYVRLTPSGTVLSLFRIFQTAEIRTACAGESPAMRS